MHVSLSTEYWIKPGALTIYLNYGGKPDFTQVSVLSGAVIMAFSDGIISYNAAYNFRTWPIIAYNTYINTTEECYVYARLDREESTKSKALIVYDTEYRDIEGRIVSAGDDQESNPPSKEAYFILLGKISASVDGEGNVVERKWIEYIDYGQLNTDIYTTEYRDNRYVHREFFEKVFSFYDKNNNLIPVNEKFAEIDSVESKIGLWTEHYLSCRGKNPSSSGGGGGGASALYQLLDVLPNASNDGVLNAVKGSVLTYNGTKWQAGTIHVPTNLSEFTNDSGFITSAAIPTKLSAFTNDSGFITSSAIPTSLKNPYALKFGSHSYDGSSAKTITASDLGALTSHQSIYQLTIKANDATVLTFTPNSAAGSISFVAGSNISLSADATNKKITIANTYSYTHPSGGANVTIAAASGKVLGAITVNSLGHVTSVSAKTLVAADVTDLADVLDDYATITYVNDELAGTNETVSALVEKVNNFLEGTDTDGIINKWKELEAFLAGQTQTSTLADLLNVKAFASTKIIAGTGLTGGGDLTADRTLSLAASGVTAGTYPKVTVDQYGRVTAGSSLLVDDIPNIPWSKITSGKPTTLTGYGITDGVNEVKISGSGNAVTAASVSGHVLTLTKGVTFLPQSSFDDLFEKVLLSDGKTYAIRAKYGFYSDSFVSAKGLNPSSSGGGGGGASALYQLLDVVPNSTGTGVQGAVSGTVLMYNGSKWQAGIISVPNALSQLTNDTGFITSAALPTKVSQLNNDAGYITGITKSMVEGVLTGNITSHTHSQYLTEHQSIYSLTLNAGAFTKDIYTPNSAAKTINIPTTTSHIAEGNNLYFTNQRAVDALSATLLGYQPLISDLEIIRNSASEGHTAYGWGNHANAGYLTTIDSTMVVSALGYTPYNSTNPNGYISGITKSMVENVLTGNITSHSHTFASITSKPTTIAGYGITDAYTATTIDSKLSGYLPLSGGTITGDLSLNQYLRINAWSGYGSGSCDMWFNGNNGLLLITAQNITNYFGNTFIHSGNFNSYAPTLTGTGASGTWGINISGNAATATNADMLDGKHSDEFGLFLNNAAIGDINTIRYGFRAGKLYGATNAVNDGAYRGFLEYGLDGYVAQFNSDSFNNLFYRWCEASKWLPWKQIAFTDSNVASAGKLQTARTIWGQSFDGTGNVDGNLTANGNIAATGAITAKASSSDIRLKKDIGNYSAIDIIRCHRSMKFHWNDVAKANSDVFKDDYWHYGLIAQEMQEDMPQMVSDVFKDYLVINYERLIPICWKGLQEVDDEVTRLKKKVRKLEKEIRELKQGA